MKKRIIIRDQQGNLLGMDTEKKQAFTGGKSSVLDYIPSKGDELIYRNFRQNTHMNNHKLRTQHCIVNKIIHEIEEDWNSSFMVLVTVYVNVLYDKEE
jgi:hypothetical protein